MEKDILKCQLLKRGKTNFLIFLIFTSYFLKDGIELKRWLILLFFDILSCHYITYNYIFITEKFHENQKRGFSLLNLGGLYPCISIINLSYHKYHKIILEFSMMKKSTIKSWDAYIHISHLPKSKKHSPSLIPNQILQKRKMHLLDLILV